MRHISQIFSRKVLSIICALAIMLSCVSVGFGAFADTGASADAAQYEVNANAINGTGSTRKYMFGLAGISDPRGYFLLDNASNLNNDISAVNDGSEYPVREKYYYQPVVDATVAESYTDSDKKEIYFSNLPNAIDYLDGNAGKIWIKGDFAPDKTQLDGSMENRGEITIAGYGDSAAGGKFIVPRATYGSGMNGAWTKGDVRFKNITMDAEQSSREYSSDVSISSGNYKITFDTGVETGTYKINIAANTYNGNNVTFDIYSGDYQVISGLSNSNYYSKKSDGTPGAQFGPYNMNVNVNIYGGSVDKLYTTSGSTYHGPNRTIVINGDVNYTVNNDTTIKTLNLTTYGYGSDVQVNGNTIYRINGGTITDEILAQLGHTNLQSQALYNTPNRGNIAVIVDADKTKKAVIGCGSGWTSLNYFKMAEGKYLIGIINNYDKANNKVYFDTIGYGDKAVSKTNPCVLDRYDYKITVAGGEAQPYFIRTNPDDPATSFLKGFTLKSNTEGLIPVVNGVVIPTVKGVTTENGETVYDLSAYLADRNDASDDADITSITFVEKTEIEKTEETVTDEETLADYKNQEVVPEKEGYIFAGFVNEDGTAMNWDEIEEAESLTVKFVPKAVLDVKWQVRENEDDATATDLRLITTLDSTQYKKVIFKFSFNGTDKYLESFKAYKGIEETVGGVTNTYTADEVNCAASEYVVTHVLTGIPSSQNETEFTVTAYFVTMEGREIAGDSVSFTIAESLK